MELIDGIAISAISIFLVSLLIVNCIPFSSTQSSVLRGNNTSFGVNASSPVLVLNQSITDTEFSRGVPVILSLSYGNGSFLTSGNVSYTVKFDFGEPFIFSDIKKGNFSDATILSNDTVRFQSTPLSKGENKTGVVTFLFDDGLAEKSRKVNLEYDLTVDSIQSTRPDTKLPLITNDSGTFANDASIFTNTSQFTSLFGEEPEPIAQDLINDIPVSTITDNLDNLTSGELAGIINTVRPAIRDEIIMAAPPLSPPVSITVHNQSGPLNSSVLSYGLVMDLLKVIPGVVNETSMVVYQVYSTWTPCVSFDSIRPSETTTSNTGSLVQYKVKINNCAKIFEKINLASKSKVRDVSHFFSIDRFDMPPNTSKEIDLYFIVPSNITPGFYIFDVTGRVIGPFNVIAAESAGKIPLRVDRVE